VALLISAVHELRALNLFLNPYYRATSYSGDQIALACCGDLRIALAATERLMSGKDVAPTVAATGVIDQAAAVTQRILPRLAQLFAPEPHLTNRYLNLCFYAQTHETTGWRSFLDALGHRTAAGLETLGTRSPHRPATKARVAELESEAAEAGEVRVTESWESDAGTIGSALFALLAVGLFAWGKLAAPGNLEIFGTAVLAVDAVLVVGLGVAAAVTLVRRTPSWVAATALLSAAFAGWTGLLPALDAAIGDYLDGSLSIWLSQAAALAALVATVALAASRGRRAALIERAPTTPSRLWALGAMAGGVLVVVSSFLPAYDFGGGAVSFWEVSGGIYDVLHVAVGVGLIAMAIAAAAPRALTLPFLATAMSCLAFFLVFSPFDFNEEYSLEVGWWLALGGAAAALTCAGIGWLAARPIRGTAP
jgi:hypothetical protein